MVATLASTAKTPYHSTETKQRDKQHLATGSRLAEDVASPSGCKHFLKQPLCSILPLRSRKAEPEPTNDQEIHPRNESLQSETRVEVLLNCFAAHECYTATVIAKLVPVTAALMHRLIFLSCIKKTARARH